MKREPCSGTEGNMKRFPGCSSFFPTFAVALTLMFLSLRAHGQSNLVQLVSQPGDWIGQGNTYVTTNKANFTFSGSAASIYRSEEHTSELQSLRHLVCRLLLEKKKKKINTSE